MTTQNYTSPFTGTVVTPTDVSYELLNFSSNTTLYWPTTVNSSQIVAARIIDCVATVSGLTIKLPDASQGSLGTDILFRNLGANAFTIADNAGGASISVPTGIAKYLYLTNNASQAGTWGNVTFGAGTSVADAATLAGLGLTTYNGKLATTQNVIDITSAPSVTNNSRGVTYNWKAGTTTINLPSVQTLSMGWYIAFRNSGTGVLNFTPSSPELINGSATISTNPGDSGWIMYDSDSGGFITVGWIAPSAVVFNSATYDVDNIVGNSLSLVSFAPIIQTYIAQSGSRTQTLTVTLPAITQLYVLANNTNQTGYNINFKCIGSSATALVVQAGQILTVLSDGTNLYSLTSASTGIYYASNGSASVPSFSFSNDSTTGLYLKNIGNIGITAGTTEIVDINNSNPTNPVVTVYATLNAKLISGGSF
jgi:hypothetical protein